MSHSRVSRYGGVNEQGESRIWWSQRTGRVKNEGARSVAATVWERARTRRAVTRIKLGLKSEQALSCKARSLSYSRQESPSPFVCVISGVYMVMSKVDSHSERRKFAWIDRTYHKSNTCHATKPHTTPCIHTLIHMTYSVASATNPRTEDATEMTQCIESMRSPRQSRGPVRREPRQVLITSYCT